MYVQGTEWEGVDWTELAQDGENWPAVVTTAIDFGVHKMPYISWLAEELLASEEGFCSMEVVSQSVSQSVSLLL